MNQNGWADTKFLVDGFPRNQDNKEGYEKILAPDCEMPFVIYLECSKETMIKRIQKRANESEELRNDDNMEVLVKRFQTFKDQSLPIIEQYAEIGKLRTFDANQTAEKVTLDVVKVLRDEMYI